MAIWGAKNGYCFGKDKYLARMYNRNEITKQDYVALKTEPIEIIREKLKNVETFEQIRGELEIMSYAVVGSVAMSTFYPLVFTYIVYDYVRTDIVPMLSEQNFDFMKLFELAKPTI